MAAAVGGVVTEAVVDRLKARMFVPGSNNALADIFPSEAFTGPLGSNTLCSACA